MTDSLTSAPRRRAALAFIFVTVVLDVLAFGVIIPVLPRLIEQFRGGNTAYAAETYGISATAWALMQFLFSPVLGALSDRFGRRPVILISCFGLGLDYIVMALAPSLGWLLVGRILSGITASSFSVSAAYVADITPPEKRAAGYGILGAAFGVGFVIGPAMGGVLGSISERLPFWTAAALALVSATYGLFVLPESLPPERRSPFRWARANPIGALKLLRSYPGLTGLAAINLLFQIARYVLPSVFVLYTSYRYHWDAQTTGLTLTFTGLLNVVVEGGLVRPFVARFGERISMFAGLSCGTAGFLWMALAPDQIWFWAGMPIFALMGLFNPGLQSLMTRRVLPTEQGQLQGANTSLVGIAGLIAPGLFTVSFAWFIGPGASLHLPGAPFLLAATLTFSALLLTRVFTRPALPATA